jgi:Glycosyltransferase family 87
VGRYRASTGAAFQIRSSLSTGLMRLVRDPHAVLAAGALVTLALEFLRGSAPTQTSIIWPVLQAGVGAAALVFVWRRQNVLRLLPVALLGVTFQLAWIGVHLALGVPSDFDSEHIYGPQGQALLHGTYPWSEYPPGAVLLFALEALLGGGQARVSHAFVMVPFHLLLILGIWSLRTSWSAWFATVAAFWPLNAFIAEFRFDVVPAALLVLGFVLARRDRWFLAGAALGLGAAAKWTPALAVAALALWLLTTNRPRAAVAHLAGAAATFLAINVPFLVWSTAEVLYAYRAQGPRGIIGESLPYLPLRLLGLAQSALPWDEAVVPSWASGAAIAVQALAVLATFAAVVATRSDSRAALSIAAVCPVVFLVFNRVFSPQFLILLLAAWAIAGSLLAKTEGDQLLLGMLFFCASLANTLVYPTLSGFWPYFSGFLFAFALAATMWVFVRAGLFDGLTRTSRERHLPWRAQA